MESALTTAGNKEVALLFDPKLGIALFSSDAYYGVWN